MYALGEDKPVSTFFSPFSNAPKGRSLWCVAHTDTVMELPYRVFYKEIPVSMISGFEIVKRDTRTRKLEIQTSSPCSHLTPVSDQLFVEVIVQQDRIHEMVRPPFKDRRTFWYKNWSQRNYCVEFIKNRKLGTASPFFQINLTSASPKR